MSSRLPVVLLVVVFLTLPVIAKNKKKANPPRSDTEGTNGVRRNPTRRR
jgi:hypothetical protein